VALSCSNSLSVIFESLRTARYLISDKRAVAPKRQFTATRFPSSLPSRIGPVLLGGSMIDREIDIHHNYSLTLHYC